MRGEDGYDSGDEREILSHTDQVGWSKWVGLCMYGFLCQGEEGIRVLVRSRGRGDVYKGPDGHVAAARALLDEGGAVGRRLDFLAQELNREVNTLCAKSNELSLTEIGLRMKSTVDQFREQVQNLE